MGSCLAKSGSNFLVLAVGLKWEARIGCTSASSHILLHPSLCLPPLLSKLLLATSSSHTTGDKLVKLLCLAIVSSRNRTSSNGADALVDATKKQ